jgi:hypothetical protein
MVQVKTCSEFKNSLKQLYLEQILDRIEKFDDTKGLVRSCKLKNRRKYNDQTLFGTGNRIEMFGDTKEGNQKPTVN